MNEPGPTLWLAKPQLSDQAAAELLDFLQELITCFENAYYDQIHRHYADLDHPERQQPPPQPPPPGEDPF